jgi:hypothetical protein
MSFPLRNRAPASISPVSESRMNARFASVLSVLLLITTSSLRAETAEQWIAKARAYLGSESALNSVNTIHFTGTLEAAEHASAGEKDQSAKQPEKWPVEIVFQKPYQQRMTVNRPDSIDVMTLDDYEGWAQTTVRKDPKQWRVNLLGAEQIKQLRANTWENLSFFAGLEKKGGTVLLGEDAVIDGIACAKLSFIHSDRIVFHRYFEKTSGRLVKTETTNHSEIREEGEITVNGVRFPKKIINKAETGQSTIIIFETVVLNERIPAAEFAVPSLRSE